MNYLAEPCSGLGTWPGQKRAFAEDWALPGRRDAMKRGAGPAGTGSPGDQPTAYANPPQPDRLLEVLEATIAAQPSGESDATVQMWLACALGQKFRELQLANAPLPERTAISDRAYAAVKKSLDAGMTLSWLQLLTNRNDPGKAGQPQTEREDNLDRCTQNSASESC